MTRMITSVVFFMITALIASSIAPATELATTPGDNRIVIYEPVKWSWDDTHARLKVIAPGVGYTTPVIYQQEDAPSAPHDADDLTIGDFVDALACDWAQQWGPGIVALAGHGTATAFCVMYYPPGNTGREERQNDFAALVTTYSGLDTVTTDDGWAIEVNAGFLKTYYKPAPANSGEVYLGGCQMLNLANDAFGGKTRNCVGYAYKVYVYNVNTDADYYWQSRAGENGVALTTAAAASDHEPSGILQLGGNGASVLKPFVSRYRPAASSIISGTTTGSVTFNCKMGPNPFCVNGTGSFSVDTQQFLNDSTYSFVIRKNGDTDGEIVVDGTGAVSGNGRPLVANYSFYLCTAQYCDLNRAAGFEGAWAWQMGGEDSIVFITSVETGSDSFRLEGFLPGASVPESCITMPAHGRPWLYSLAVPHGLYDRYQVVEIIDGKEAERSLGFGVSQGPPENLAALRATSLPWPPPENAPPPEMGGRASPPQPAHLVAYSSSSSLMGALQSVWDSLTVKFHWTVNTVVGGKSAASCQSAFYAQWQANLNVGWPAPRCAVVGESNEDTASVHNIVSMQQVPDDATGDCYYGSCANPGWWVDFYNNGTGQCPLYRLPVTTVAEAQNYARAWQKYIAGYPLAQRTLYLDVGDRIGYTTDPSFRVLSEQVIAPLYSAAGYAITEHLESSFPIGLYGAARDSGRAVFNRRGALEMVSRGLVTNRSQLGAKTIQVAYDSPWTNVAVPQQCIGWWLSCDEGDDQRANPDYYPALIKRFLTANPDSYAVFVAITAYTRGGYGAHQDTIAVYLMNERWGGQATDVGDVVWRAEQNLWSTHPEVQADLYRLSVSGLPVPLPGSAGLTGIEEPAQRSVAARLWRPFPNPGTATTINFSLAVPERAILSVFDVTGRLVRTLVDRDRLPGYHSTRWDGRDNERQLVPSGVYFVRLDAGMTSVTERMILLR